MNANYRLIQQVESPKYQMNYEKKDNVFLTMKFKTVQLFFCLFVLFLLSICYDVESQVLDTIKFDCTIDTTLQDFEMETTNLFPDWMKVPFNGIRIKQRKVQADRVEFEIDSLWYNLYTINSGIYSTLTGLDNTTIKEYLTIFVLDSIANTIPVFSDPDSILEIVLFQKDTCTFDQKCRIGIFDSLVSNQHFIGGVCCTSGDPSSFETIAGMPIHTDTLSGIRYIEYWFKKRCNGNLVCCEMVYQYKSNNDSIPKFVFFDGPFKRKHFQRSCIQFPMGLGCPDYNPTGTIERRTCKSCLTISPNN